MSCSITDENLLRLLKFKKYNINLFSYEVTRLSGCFYISFEALRVDNHTFVDPVLIITFRQNATTIIGSFSYRLGLDGGEITMDRIDSYFWSDHKRLTKQQGIEKLMTYDEIKEWLIWNQI